jgi:ABC-type microcin C transport system permease subunit YejE
LPGSPCYLSELDRIGYFNQGGQTVETVDATSQTTTSGTVSFNGKQVAQYVQQTASKLVAKVMTDQVPKVAAEVAQQEIEAADRKRQALEDIRSIHRNKNRLATLIFALFASVVITFLLSNTLKGTWVGTTFGPYSFAITILFDSTLTFWALYKRY